MNPLAKTLYIILIIALFSVEISLGVEATTDAVISIKLNRARAQEGSPDLGPYDEEARALDQELAEFDTGLEGFFMVKKEVESIEPAFRSPKIILHPLDQAILELYLDPEGASQRLAEPGSDLEAFDELMQQLFGFRPSLDQQPELERVRQVVEATLKDKTKLKTFIETIERDMANDKFVTEANRAILQTILDAAKSVQQSDAPEVLQNQAQRITDQLAKVFKNVEQFSPVLVSFLRAINILPLDRRVVKTLLYLVTPRDQGGAGHERIRVERIWKDYSDPDENSEKNKSRESKDAGNISRHRFGQAIDISEIDNIKCTLYKKGVLRQKKTPRPPIPVKVAFQSEDSLARTVEGSSNLPLGFSMQEVLKELALSNILDGISDLDLEDLEEGSLKDATLSDILVAVGEQMVVKALGLGGKNFKGFDFNAIVNQVGQAMIADKLGIPRYAVKGSSLKEMEESVGRATIEQRLNLPPQSLQGQNGGQILRSIGARKLEKVMGLRRGSLNFDQDQVSPQQVVAKVGQGTIEEILNLKPGSFASSSLNDIKQRLGTFRFDLAFQNPVSVDERLKVAVGTTQRFVQQGNAEQYKQAVGQRALDDTFSVFATFQENLISRIETIAEMIGPLEGIVGAQPPNDDIATMQRVTSEILNPPRGRVAPPVGPDQLRAAAQTIEQAWRNLQNHEKIQRSREADGPMATIQRNFAELLDQPIPENLIRESSQRDAAFGAPRGTIDRFLQGEVRTLGEIGAHELAQRITFSDLERQLLVAGLTGKTANLGPLESVISASFGVSLPEFQRIFLTGGAEVFRTIGERRLLGAVRNLPEAKRFEQQALNDLRQANPELASLEADLNFRLDRIRDLQRATQRLEQLVGQTDDTRAIRQILENALRSPSVNRIRVAIGQVAQAWERLDRDQRVQTNQQALQLMEDIRRNFRAILDGEFPSSASSLSRSDIAARRRGGDSFAITVDDLFELLSGHKTPAEIATTIGLRRVESALGLPQESLFLFSQERTKSPQAFFAAVGKAKIYRLYGRGPGSSGDIESIIQRNLNRADRDLGLRTGTSAGLFNGSVTEDRFVEIVGRQALVLSAVAQVTGDLRIDGLAFTPDDIYQLVTGSQQNVFARVAGYKLDEKLHLFPGTAGQIIGARTGQERSDAIAVAGGAYLGNLLGIGPIDFRGGNPIRSTGATIVENTLGLKEGSLRRAKNVDDVRAANPRFDGIFEDAQRIDRLLGLAAETTHKFIDGALSPADYASAVGKTTLQNQLTNSPTVLGIVTGALGIEEGSQLDVKLRSFVPAVLDITLRNQGRSIKAWNPDDKVALFNGLDGLFGLEFDRRARLRPGTFAEIFANPDQARQIVLREGIRSIDEQFGLGGKIELAYNFYQLRKERQERRRAVELDPSGPHAAGYNAGQLDFASGQISRIGERGPAYQQERPQDSQAAATFTRGYDKAIDDMTGNVQLSPAPPSTLDRLGRSAVTAAQREVVSRTQQLIFQQTGFALSEQDIRGIAHGDTRVFQYIAFAETAKKFSETVNGVALPVQFRVSPDDFRAALQGRGELDQQATKTAGERASAQAIDDVVQGRVSREQLASATGYSISTDADLEIASREYARIKQAQAEQQALSNLKKSYQKDLQYKMVDGFAYRADRNIPVGFARTMVEGSAEQRTDTLLRYTANLISTNSLGITLSEDSLVSVRNYIQNPNQDSFQAVVRTGVLDSVESYLNRNNTLGFNLQPGTMRGVFEYAHTGNLGSLTRIYEDWGRAKLFSWADKTFGFPVGSSYQIYNITQGFLAAGQELQIQGLFGSQQSFAQARQNYLNAKGELISLAVNIVLRKQVGQMEQALQLVPGTGPLLVSMTVTAIVAHSFNPYVLAAFVLFNLFGFNKIQLLCTGDGYYPRIPETFNPDLYLGLGEFNGMNPGVYRQGLLQSGQGRVQGLIEDLLNMAYHFDEQGNPAAETLVEPSDNMKPIQIITRRREDFEAFFGSELYAQVFNADPPSPGNLQGILTGENYLVDNWVHIGF